MGVCQSARYETVYENLQASRMKTILLRERCKGGIGEAGYRHTTLRAQDWSRLRIQSLLYRAQGPLGKDYFRTTIFFPANFVTLLAVI